MNWIISVIIGIALAAGSSIYFMPSEPQPPVLKDVYWGPGKQPEKFDESIRSFKIKFTEEMITDLKIRLKNTRKMQPPLENTGWTYGISGHYIPIIVDYWLNKYDFKKQEAYLNQQPQFLTNIQGLDIHFIHSKPKLPKDREVQVLPLLLLHGWPGSVVEFYKIIPLLTTPRSDVDYVFEVITPSLPGFGFSSAAAKPGFGALEIAHVFKNLMLRLGHEKFYVQGGDWGASIGNFLAVLYPQHVLGIHLNLCMVLNPWSLVKTAVYSLVPSLLPEKEQGWLLPLSVQLSILIEETGYFHEQATKPDTLGVGLTDSPAALAAYILEKFSIATSYKNKLSDDGNLLEKFTMDELIDNLMMTWVPNKASSGMRIYAESANLKNIKSKINNIPIKVPSACAQFPHEIIFQPESILRDRYTNLVQATKMKQGGHFAALEEPELLAENIWSSVQLMIDFREKQRLTKNCY